MGETKPSKMKTMGIRSLSGLVLMAICGVPIYFGGWVLAIFIAIVCSWVVYEWVSMSDPDASKLALILPIVGLVGALGIAQFGKWGEDNWNWALASMGFVGALVILERMRRGGGLWAGFGALYVILPALAILWLRGDVVGVGAPGFAKFMFVVVVVIAADTFAYLGGSTLQGPKLIPKVSPNKTWSGLISGFAFGAITGAIAAWIIGFSPAYGALLALPIIASAVLGDLLESIIKRTLKVKDAGDLIPGHGGILDRMDSLMLAVVVSAAVLILWPSVWPPNIASLFGAA